MVLVLSLSSFLQVSNCSIHGFSCLLKFSTGIANGNVQKKWTTFQRCCLKYISEFLYSVRELVEAMGQDALKDYCHDGKLSAETLDKIKKFKGYLTDDSETEDYGDVPN